VQLEWGQSRGDQPIDFVELQRCVAYSSPVVEQGQALIGGSLL
jgi:hypothetical protein